MRPSIVPCSASKMRKSQPRYAANSTSADRGSARSSRRRACPRAGPRGRRTRALREGKPAFGCFVRFPDPALVEFAAYQGWDFLIFDAEHGTIDTRMCEGLVRAAELHDVTAIVRVPVNQPHVILQFMDIGPQGCQVPWVEDAADAERAVRAVKTGRAARAARGSARGRLRPARRARGVRAQRRTPRRS